MLNLDKRIKDGSLVCKPTGLCVRICSDYSISVNKSIEDNIYPLSLPKFSKIDLTSAYTQLKLEKKSQEILTMRIVLKVLPSCRLV